MQGKRLLKTRWIACLAIGILMLGSFWWTSVKGTELEEVDLSKGVTYESGYINLNGNSVIIKESANSTDTNYLCNIYLDTNRNGVIDEGEEQPVSIDGDIDIHSTLAIYGIYKQKSVTPLSITVLDGFYPVIYGVYDGELDTRDSEETACRINVQNAQIAGCISAARNSKIAAASTALDITLNNSTINTMQGVVGGQVISTSSQTALDITLNNSAINTMQGVVGGQVTNNSSQTAVNIAVNGSTQFSDTGTFEGVSEGAEIKGDITIDVSPDTTSAVSYFYGIKNGVTVDGSLDVNINHLSANEVIFSAYTGCNVTKDMTFVSGMDVYSPRCFVINKSNVEGDAAISLYGKMQQNSSGTDTQFILLQDGTVGANVDIDLKDGSFGQIYAVEHANVKGNLDIFFEAGTYLSFVWGISNSAAVDGDVTMTSGEETEFTSDFRGCLGNSIIGGNMTVDIYNTNTNSNSSNTFQPIGEATVTGKIDVRLHEGTWGYVYGINGGSGSYKKEYKDDCRVEFTNVKAGRMFGISGASITGAATVILTGCESSGLAIRGIDSSEISGDATVTTIGGSAKDNIYGISNTTILGNATISTSDAICTGNYSVYGLYTVELGGSATVDVEGCTAYSVCGAYETNTTKEDCDITISINDCTVSDIYGISNRGNDTITGTTDVTIANCTVSDTIYGIYYPNCQKDVTIRTANNKLKNFIGIYSGTVAGAVTIITNGDNRDTASEGYYYGLQYGTVNGDVTITTSSSQYGDYKAVYNATCNANALITIDGCTYTGSYIQPFDSSTANMNGGEVNIICRDTAFTSDTPNARISNSLSGGTITMTIEDSCTINDVYELSPLYYGGANALLTYQNDYYYAGSYPITEDINARNIYFGKKKGSDSVYANMKIPEGITVTAEEQIYIPNCGRVLIEGTLNGTVFQGDENYTDGSIYMNGGVMEEEEKMNNRFYPLTLSYIPKGGTTKFGVNSVSMHPLCPNQYFALVGDTPAVTCTAKKGYTLTEVTVTKGSGEPQVLTADDDDKYSFEMEACPTELSITFTGTQITLDKMRDSLTTKLYEETTTDAPLYDVTTIEISNDGEEGDVTYEAAEATDLPAGLILEDGKLFGTPTQAFEDGTDVVIQVTGRNDTTAEFTLHITVMAGDEDGTPAYRVPEGLTAVYGDTLGDVALPSDENGSFTWKQEESTPVGNVGTHEFLVTYTPANKNYNTVTDIPVTVTVQKATVVFSKIEEVTAKHGDTLADLVLPETPGGEYFWVTAATVEPVDQTVYQLGFRPEDVDNYDWTAVGGWDEETSSVLMPVKITIQHVYGTEWEKDEENHWHTCVCGEMQGKAEHTWDAGIVTREATETEDGLKQYTCTKCEATKEEVIPATGTIHTHVYSDTWETDNNFHWHACTCGEIQGKAKHVWNNGVVIKEATATEDGVKQYTCTVCNRTRTETIKATGNTGNNPQNPAPVDGPQNPTQTGTEKSTPAMGTILTDSVTKAKYQVTSKTGEEPTVMYLSSTNASASTLSIAANVTIDGISYKVTAIADNAFKNNKKLKKITIGANIITIGNNAFYGCTALSTVKMGNSVQKIGNKTFYGCKKLTALTLGANVTTLGNSVFYNCIALKKVTIPKKVKKIGSKAFYNCKKLVSITIKTTKLTTKNVGSKAFTKAGSSNYKKLQVKVPKKKLKAYKTMLKKKGLSPKAKVKK